MPGLEKGCGFGGRPRLAVGSRPDGGKGVVAIRQALEVEAAAGS